MRTLSLFLVLLITGFAAHMVNGQDLAELIRTGDKLHEEQSPQKALAVFEKALRHDSTNAEVLWRMAREYYDLASISDEKEELYRKAETYARKSLAADSTNAKSHLWVAISVGKVALQRGGKEKVELSKEVRDEAERSIELDNSDDAAYHALARWHYEVATLSWILKTAAKIVYGGLPEASIEKSVEYFQRAIELAPNNINHHLHLGKTYLELGREEEAIRELQKAVDLPVQKLDDPKNKQEAEQLLREL